MIYGRYCHSGGGLFLRYTSSLTTPPPPVTIPRMNHGLAGVLDSFNQQLANKEPPETPETPGRRRDGNTVAVGGSRREKTY